MNIIVIIIYNNKYKIYLEMKDLFLLSLFLKNSDIIN